MPKINVLPKSVAELIAAGEVVERPRSVVKELMENSIDAGADRITVEIKNGGVRYIRVTDNGCGIAREDVRTAFISHATSKISGAEDLSQICTLGFRGEALPSVAAVSRLTLLTRTAQEEEGTQIGFEGGQETAFESAGCPVGATIVVRDLFFNTPARMKFLKKDVTEGNYVADAVTRAALSHPEIKFTLIRDEKRALDTPGSGDLAETVYAVFGKEAAASLLPCAYAHDGVAVSGFVSKPLYNRPNRNMQFFFVNGRCVRVPAAAPALDNAYKNSIMTGKFPLCFLNITVDVGKTDVNVHPAKTEIRFADESKIYEAVYFAAKSALAAGDTARPAVQLKPGRDLTAPARPEGEQLRMDARRQPFGRFPEEMQKPNPAVAEIFRPWQRPEPFPANRGALDIVCDGPEPLQFRDEAALVSGESALRASGKNGETGYAPPEPLPATQPAPPPETAPQPPVPAVNAPVEDVRILGEAFRTYIIAQHGDKLLIVDKHAAHERIIYNELIAARGAPAAQLLLAPVPVALSAREYAAVIENLGLFAEAGFEVEDFGLPTVLVRACPALLTDGDVPSLISEIAGQLAEANACPEPERLTRLYETAACKAAIKAGGETRPAEMLGLVERLLGDDALRYCPHGRPVLVELSRAELEKQFGRIQ